MPSKLSFIVSKADNIDMVGNNVRMVDSKGKINSFGRVEIRVNDGWYAVCGASKNKEIIADMLCQAGG